MIYSVAGGMTLRFVHTALSDAGRYKCVVSNAAGVKNKEFHLNVLGMLLVTAAEVSSKYIF